MQDTPHEPWIADIALELQKIREILEEGLPVVVVNVEEFND